MDKQFDELSKSLAQDGVSRRDLLARIGGGLAGLLLALLGTSGGAAAQKPPRCQTAADCPSVGYRACCNGYCSSLLESNNCGACGVTCPSGYKCCQIGATVACSKGGKCSSF